MAKKITENGLTVVTTADYDRLETAKSIITECQLQSDGLAERIAGQLYVVNEKKLYELDDCKTTAEWADKFFDISKGTVSDAINTFKRFGDLDQKDQIKEEYRLYAFSSLMKMKALTDEQIKLAGIEPTMSRKQIVDAIKALKVLEDKQAQLPVIQKEWLDTYKKFVDTASKADPDENSTELALKLIAEAMPEYFEKSKANSLTVEDYETLINMANAYIEEWERVEKETEEAEEAEHEPETEHEPEATQEPEAKQEEEGPHTMPTLSINVADFMNGDKFNMKEFLARVKEEVPKVIANEVEIIIR